MVADLSADHAADDAEFAARLGQFSLISSDERTGVLAARTNAVHERLAHVRRMVDRAAEHGERWAVLITEEQVRRYERELAWLAELSELVDKNQP
jgi:hypothetical protein